MLFRRFDHPGLAQAGYLIGCGTAREAIIIDPLRDIDIYLAAARAERMRIVAVTETHVHADYLSGARELAAQTGAQLYLSGEGGGAWSYTDDYLRASGAIRLHDGDVIRAGAVRAEAIHTPGHTPEHLSFLVTDTAGAAEPMGAVTGDFVFVGDVGRPDLLERAVNVAGSSSVAARQLFHSLRRLADQPDYLQIWPGHGAGSACGKGLSAVPQSTLGYERRHNWAFRVDDEERFVTEVLEGQPEAPAYFADMKRLNAAGPPLRNSATRPARLEVADVIAALANGTVVIDTRPVEEYGAGHIPGTINIVLDRSFLTWVGSVVPIRNPVLLLGNETHLAGAVRDLTLIGIDHVVGYAGLSVFDAWRQNGRELERALEISAETAIHQVRSQAATVIDVRSGAEWTAGHVPDAVHVPLEALTARLPKLPRDRQLIVHCQSGARSAIAVSALLAAGFHRIADLRGGLVAWQRAGGPVVAESAAKA